MKATRFIDFQKEMLKGANGRIAGHCVAHEKKEKNEYSLY